MAKKTTWINNTQNEKDEKEFDGRDGMKMIIFFRQIKHTY
jgi:hypothetical protein